MFCTGREHFKSKKCNNSTIGGDQSELSTHIVVTAAFIIQTKFMVAAGWTARRSVDLIGKTNVLGTAFVFDVAEG